jgi:protocatechuate 3,4-dioxygenase beta subunit
MVFRVEDLEQRDCPAVVFTNIFETSPTDPTPLFGTTPTVIGNSAQFDPNTFRSQANAATPNDSTVGFLTFVVDADPGTTINRLDFRLAGDATIIGSQSSFASAGVSANVVLTVTEIDGIAVGGPSRAVNLVFNPNNGQYSLAQNGNSTGLVFVGTASVDINDLLTANSITGRATKVSVNLTTLLDSDASTQGSAFIQLKQASIEANTTETQVRGSLGDFVWRDNNGNGVFDSGDVPLANVRINLIYAGADGQFGTADDTTATDTTDANGIYGFANLLPGRYRVSVDQTTLPAGLRATFDLDGGFDSTADAELTVNNLNRTDVDFAYAPATGRIGDTIFRDRDSNGAQNGTEPGIAGVTVTLLYAGLDGNFDTTADNQTFTDVTDANGNYLFEDLTPGNYRVTVTTATGPLVGLVNTADPNGGSDSTSQVSLTAQALENLQQDFGYDGGSIGDTIFRDNDGNGQQNGSEPGIAGVTVTLLYAGPDGDFTTTADNQTFTDVTDADGKYLFEDLRLGNYRVTVTTNTGPLAGLRNTADPDGGLNSTSQLTLGTTNRDNVLQDFGYVEDAGAISGVVYADVNNNGIVGNNEVGIGGVTVTLQLRGTNGQFTNLRTTTTDAAGFYVFNDLAPGTYRVIETHPTNYIDGQEAVGTLGGTTTNDRFELTMTQNQIGVGYNFGERGLTASNVTKRLFLANSPLLNPAPTVLSGLQSRFGTSSTNAPLVNAYLNPVQARANGFNGSQFADAFSVGTAAQSQRSRPSNGTGNDGGGLVEDEAFESLDESMLAEAALQAGDDLV